MMQSIQSREQFGRIFERFLRTSWPEFPHLQFWSTDALDARIYNISETSDASQMRDNSWSFDFLIVKELCIIIIQRVQKYQDFISASESISLDKSPTQQAQYRCR